ncbi:unnamed protein product [Rhizophagus irregularis]|nr:unnamed protein product [Rhizophagus irregularis]
MNNNYISQGDNENFLKNLLNNFYNKIIETNDFNNFEKNFIGIKNEIKINNYNDYIDILNLMENHKESKFWFTSLIGFFYQHGIGCNLDKEKALDFYLLVIDNEKIENDLSNENFNLLKNKNIIIGKYLLSLFYYKDIIIDIEGFNYYQSKGNNNQNGLMKLVKLAKNGDLDAQYNLAIHYMDGVEIQKNEEKAFEWFLKSEQSEYLIANDKKEKEEFEKLLKLAIADNLIALFHVGN